MVFPAQATVELIDRISAACAGLILRRKSLIAY
jgi:hypothetical protein